MGVVVAPDGKGIALVVGVLVTPIDSSSLAVSSQVKQLNSDLILSCLPEEKSSCPLTIGTGGSSTEVSSVMAIRGGIAPTDSENSVILRLWLLFRSRSERPEVDGVSCAPFLGDGTGI